jgi:hypothetical protein
VDGQTTLTRSSITGEEGEAEGIKGTMEEVITEEETREAAREVGMEDTEGAEEGDTERSSLAAVEGNLACAMSLDFCTYLFC